MRTGLEAVTLIANATGFLSFFLLFLATAWGIVLRNGWGATWIRHSSLYSIHQTFSLIGLSLAAVHALSVEVFRGEQVRLIDVFVPFASNLGLFGRAEQRYYDAAATPANRIGISVGVIALEIMVAAAASVLIQRKLGYNRWRALHSLTYAAFSLMVAHIMITGADAGSPWIWGAVGGCWLATMALWLGAPAWATVGKSPLGRLLPMGQRHPTMVVTVDPKVCERAGFCTQAAPDIFRLRSDGRLSYRSAVYLTEVEAVTRAAEVCPVRAIVLGMAPTTVETPQPFLLADDARRDPSQLTHDRQRGAR